MKVLILLSLLLSSLWVFPQKEYSILSIPPELLKNSNSVVLEECVEVDVSNIRKMTTVTRRAVAVLNKLGDNDVSLYEFYNENSKVKNIETWIYNGLGKEIGHYKKRDFLDVSRTGNNMYMDSRMLYLNYTPTVYPYIVVFESETESGDTAFLGSWGPINGYAESTQKSIYKIKFDTKNKPRFKARNLDGYNISIEEKPTELVFTASNLKPIRYEEDGPISSKIFPHINLALDTFYLKGTMGSAKNWKEFGLWMEKDLLQDVREVPEATLSQIKSLVANETTNEAKARKIYQYVQNKVRYISIQIGIGGWKPMTAAEVDKLSYGDCKALTNYTKALLEAVGIPSYYTILYGDSNKWDIKEDFTSMQGNHVILGIPDGDKITWLECTSQDKPYGYMGRFTNDRDVLILTPEGGKIARTKVYETSENTQEISAKVKVGPSGEVMAIFSSVSKGIQYEDKYLIPKKKSEEIERYYKHLWSHINGFSVSNIKFINDDISISFTENMLVKIPNYADAVGDDFLFCPNIFNQNSNIPPRNEDRKQNIYIGNGFNDIDQIEVEIPSNYIIDFLPEPTVLENEFGKYEIDFSLNDEKKLVYTRKFQIEKGEYSPSEYEAYREFFRTISRLDRTKILLKYTVE